jgi:hypothetical protein
MRSALLYERIQFYEQKLLERIQCCDVQNAVSLTNLIFTKFVCVTSGLKKKHCTKPTNIHLWRVITYTIYLTVVVTLFTKKSANKLIKYLNEFHFISQQDSHCCIIISEMSGSNIAFANMQTNHDCIDNWDLEQCIVYLTCYVFDFWVANSETEMNRGFPLCFQAILKWQY